MQQVNPTPLSITLYDSYLRSNVEINSANTVEYGKIKMYSCGPTVYGYQSIGNMRAIWLPDTIAMVAKLAGYDVEWVSNITDVGHLVDDGDDGEDKMEKGAKREGKNVREIVDFYTNDFRAQTESLHFRVPTGTYNPKATEYITEQMVLALELLRDKKAYINEDGIYFESDETPQDKAKPPYQGGYHEVIGGNLTIQTILNTIQNLQKQKGDKPLIIAIDGRGGSGKSTLGKKIAENVSDSLLVQTDSFEKIRLFSEEFIQKKFEVDFRENYDFQDIKSQILKNTQKIVIVEGCFTNMVDIDFDLRIWVDLDPKIATERLNTREIRERVELDSETIKLSTKKWQETEDKYIQDFKPDQKADLVISTENSGYEIVRSENAEIEKIVNTIIQLQKEKGDKPLIVVIDGRGGSGKSTLAEKLTKLISNSVAIEQDKFLEFMKGMDTKLDSWNHRNFELDKDALSKELENHKNKEVIILEGIKSLENIESDLKIWLEFDVENLQKRAENRDVQGDVNPIGFKKFWQEFEEHAQEYIQDFKPQQKADLIVSTENGGYEIVEDRTEWSDFAKNLYDLIPKWWENEFKDVRLENFEIISNGINCNVKINNQFILKILQPKYSWLDENENPVKILENYKKIKDLNLSFIPKIEKVGYSDILMSDFILSKLIDGQDLFEVYHQFDIKEKGEIIKKFVELIKGFNLTGFIHDDLHFGNIIYEKKSKKLYLTDFDNLKKGEIWEEIYAIMQGFLLPSSCVSSESKINYQEPLWQEFVEIIKLYPELLPKEKIPQIIEFFHDCFDEKLKHPKFKSKSEPIYKLVLEKNIFQLLADQKYQEVESLFEKEFDSNSQKNYTGRNIVQSQKRSSEDFAIWKFVPENSLQKWKFADVVDQFAFNILYDYFYVFEEDDLLDYLEQYDLEGKFYEWCDLDPEYISTFGGMAGKMVGFLAHRYWEQLWGCPGWHSECVAMISQIIGTKRFSFSEQIAVGDAILTPVDSDKNKVNKNTTYEIDIHTGGEDHIDIHHKNERLQSEALGFHLSKYWVHNKFVLIDNKKMSKSLGNIYLVKGEYKNTGFYSFENPPIHEFDSEFKEQIIKKYKELKIFDIYQENTFWQNFRFDPIAYRLMLMEHHYIDQMNFTWEKLWQSQMRLWNLRKDMARIVSFAHQNQINPEVNQKQIQILLGYLRDDLGTPKFIEKFQDFLGDVVNEIQKNNTLNPKNLGALLFWESEFLKLDLDANISPQIKQLVEQRQIAKSEKNYEKSDQIRSEIQVLGYQVDDYTWGSWVWKR